jgi:hypothetical protein
MNQNLEPLFVPGQKNFEVAYNLALKLAAEKLSHISDIEDLCRKSGSTCLLSVSPQIISLRYLNRLYQVTLPDVQISFTENTEPVELRDKILILHYLIQAKGTPLSGQMISFHELKEAAVYFPTFSKRVIRPLIEHFGKNPDHLSRVSSKLGGIAADFGDSSVTIPAFSRVPVTLVVWKDDEEFPANANVLFDSTIQEYLPSEDIVILCQTIIWKLAQLGNRL